jgi:hypothetical protein
LPIVTSLFISIVLFLSKVPSTKTLSSSEWLQRGAIKGRGAEPQRGKGAEGQRGKGAEEQRGKGEEGSVKHFV